MRCGGGYNDHLRDVNMDIYGIMVISVVSRYVISNCKERGELSVFTYFS